MQAEAERPPWEPEAYYLPNWRRRKQKRKPNERATTPGWGAVVCRVGEFSNWAARFAGNIRTYFCIMYVEAKRDG